MEEELGTDNFHIRRGRNYFYDKNYNQIMD